MYAYVFLRVQQAFDKVWYQQLLYKVNFSYPIYLMLEAYLTDRYIDIKKHEKTTKLHLLHWI